MWEYFIPHSLFKETELYWAISAASPNVFPWHPFQLYAYGWHLLSQTKMAESGAPNSTGRESISPYVDICQRTFLLLYTARVGERSWRNQYMKCQPHGTLLFGLTSLSLWESHSCDTWHNSSSNLMYWYFECLQFLSRLAIWLILLFSFNLNLWSNNQLDL